MFKSRNTFDINRLLKGVNCTCGKRHTCDIEAVYIGAGATRHLKKLCKKYSRILLVCDENTFAAAGERVLDVLGSKVADRVTFDGATVLIPDEAAVSATEAKLADCDLIIGIGSGVIQDLCKYVSHFNQVPYMVVATAPSMDGYASSGAAMILKGMKETVAAGLPRAIVADTDILKDAPMEMIQAGYGDIIGKYSSLCDWKLSAAVNGEYFCQWIYDLTMTAVKRVEACAAGLAERDEKALAALTEALVVVGILMSFAGSSRPASGSEHHLSHFFEIVGIVKNEAYFPHGIDVVYSTVVTAKIREALLNKPFPDTLFRPEREAYVAKMDEVYGMVGKECVALQDRIGNYAADRLSVYREKEEEIRSILAEMPSAEAILGMLRYTDLDFTDFVIHYGEQKLRTAVTYAKDLKDRYTVLWLYYDLFGGVDDVQ